MVAPGQFMAFTQADLDAIDAEIATIRTVKSTTVADQSTTFRDLKELYAERQRIAQSLTTGTSRTRLAGFRKGV
jgi:hypothetical protein